MEKKTKHLEMIQNIITRMASNSFMLKGWAVTLMAGIFVLASKDTNKIYFLFAFIPVVVFWVLDSYYLSQERLYRDLYEDVRKTDVFELEFSLDASIYKRDEYKKIKRNRTVIGCMFSKTEIWFYLPLVIICAFVFVLTQNGCI